MAFNPTVPALATKVEYRTRPDSRAAPPALTALTDYISGRLTFRLNSASTLSLLVPNGDGRYTKFFHPGMELRVKVALEDVTNVFAMFEGRVTPGEGMTSTASPGDVTLDAYAVGVVGLLQSESTHIGDYTDVDGNPRRDSDLGSEVSVAIRKQVEALTWEAVSFAIRTKGTDPPVILTEEQQLDDGFYTRRAIVDHYLSLAVDDSDPDVPREYIYYDAYDSVPAFVFRKKPDIENDPAVRTLDWEADILTSRSIAKVEQTTHCIARSSLDPAVFEEYESASMLRRYGRYTEVLDVPTTNRDTLLQRARQFVAVHRRPVFSLGVAVADVPLGYHIGQVIELDNAQFGLSGSYMVSEIGFDFSPSSVLTTLTLSSEREILSDFLV